MLNSAITAAEQVFTLVAVTIVASILLHFSTDVAVARWFDDERETPAWHGAARRVRTRLRGGGDVRDNEPDEAP